MRICLISRPVIGAVKAGLVGAFALWLASPALAQSGAPSAGSTSCFIAPAKLSDEAVAQFMANPSSVISAQRKLGTTLASTVRTLVGSDTRTIDPLIALAKDASPEIKADIAAGLANAAATCVWTRPEIARLIHEKIAASGDGPLFTAFLAVSSAIQTAATGTPGGGAGGVRGGSAGSGGGGNNARPQPQRGDGSLGSVSGSRGGGNTNTAGDTSNATGSDRVSEANGTEKVKATINTRKSNSGQLFTPEGPVSQTVQ
jgi:hypothetical protein